MKSKVSRSSGNVFKDLGFSDEEAEHLKIRSMLMVHISELMKSRKLTQARAAAVFGVTQPRLSDLVRGKIHLFSIDMLIDMLARAGVTVKVIVQRGSRPRLKAA